MPYMLRLTNTGIAMHFGNVSRRAASHGCVRMEATLAKKMYKWARVGTVVHVDGNAHNYNDFSSTKCQVSPRYSISTKLKAVA